MQFQNGSGDEETDQESDQRVLRSQYSTSLTKIPTALERSSTRMTEPISTDTSDDDEDDSVVRDAAAVEQMYGNSKRGSVMSRESVISHGTTNSGEQMYPPASFLNSAKPYELMAVVNEIATPTSSSGGSDRKISIPENVPAEFPTLEEDVETGTKVEHVELGNKISDSINLHVLEDVAEVDEKKIENVGSDMTDETPPEQIAARIHCVATSVPTKLPPPPPPVFDHISDDDDDRFAAAAAEALTPGVTNFKSVRRASRRTDRRAMFAKLRRPPAAAPGSPIRPTTRRNESTVSPLTTTTPSPQLPRHHRRTNSDNRSLTSHHRRTNSELSSGRRYRRPSGRMSKRRSSLFQSAVGGNGRRRQSMIMSAASKNTLLLKEWSAEDEVRALYDVEPPAELIPEPERDEDEDIDNYSLGMDSLATGQRQQTTLAGWVGQSMRNLMGRGRNNNDDDSVSMAGSAIGSTFGNLDNLPLLHASLPVIRYDERV